MRKLLTTQTQSIHTFVRPKIPSEINQPQATTNPLDFILCKHACLSAQKPGGYISLQTSPGAVSGSPRGHLPGAQQTNRSTRQSLGRARASAAPGVVWNRCTPPKCGVPPQQPRQYPRAGRPVMKEVATMPDGVVW